MYFRRYLPLLFALVIHTITFHSYATQDTPVHLRILWFDDGNESVALQMLLDEFEAANPGVHIELDIFNDYYYSEVTAQIQSGGAPDIVRLTELGRYRDHYLNLRPYLDNAAAWDANFPAPLLAAMRQDLASDTLHGFPTDITVSAPYINRTLFERAGVAVPSDTSDLVTWDEWTTAAAEVQAQLAEQGEDIHALAMDRSGHRFWGVSLGRCADYFDDAGAFTVDNTGFRESAAMLRGWHLNGLTPLDVWGAMGDSYIEPRDTFAEGEVALYYSGSWLVPFMAETIGDRFDWEPVPNPGEPCGTSGMIGGGVLAALDTTEHPEAVGKLMSHLTTEENLAYFYTASSLLPGHTALAARGLDYEQNATALNLFARELATVQEQAFALQYDPDSPFYHTAVRRGLIDMIVQDLTIDETIATIEATLASQPAE